MHTLISAALNPRSWRITFNVRAFHHNTRSTPPSIRRASPQDSNQEPLVCGSWKRYDGPIKQIPLPVRRRRSFDARRSFLKAGDAQKRRLANDRLFISMSSAAGEGRRKKRRKTKRRSSHSEWATKDGRVVEETRMNGRLEEWKDLMAQYLFQMAPQTTTNARYKETTSKTAKAKEKATIGWHASGKNRSTKEAEEE